MKQKVKPGSEWCLGFAPVIILLFVVMLGAIGFYISQKYNAPQITPISFSPTPAVSQVTAGDMSNWKTITVSSYLDKPLGITYRLPNSQSFTPLFDNAGHYYRAFYLPNSSRVAVIPIGKDQSYDDTYQLIMDGFQKFNIKPKTIGSYEVSEIVPKTKSLIVSQDLYLLSDSIVNFRGILFKVNDSLSLFVVHFYDKLSNTTNEQFLKDNDLFDKILSTFMFIGTDSANDKLNWSTYTNDGNEFSIKYPADVHASAAQDLVYIKSGDSILGIRYSYENNIIDLINNYEPFATPKLEYSSKESVIYGKMKGYKVIPTADMTKQYGSGPHYFLQDSTHNGTVVLSCSNGDTVCENLFNQIIGTLEILK